MRFCSRKQPPPRSQWSTFIVHKLDGHVETINLRTDDTLAIQAATGPPAFSIKKEGEDNYRVTVHFPFLDPDPDLIRWAKRQP